jgi:hypothetical protein
MNSSANQISPISLRRRNRFRAWPIFPEPAGFPDALEIPSRTGRLRAGICRQRRGLRKAESWALAKRGSGAASPLVEGCRGGIDRFAPGFGGSLNPAYRCGSTRKAAINGVLTQNYVFIKNLPLGPMVARFALRRDRSLDCSLGIPER